MNVQMFVKEGGLLNGGVLGNISFCNSSPMIEKTYAPL